MSVITTVLVEPEDFTLGAALTGEDSIEVRLERIVPLSGRFVPYLWTSDEAVEDIRTALEDETDIASFRVVDRTNGEALVRVEWHEHLDGFLEALQASDGVLLEGYGESGSWEFRLRFHDNGDLTTFYRTCSEHGVSLELQTIHNPGSPREQDIGADLTETQRETLELALEEGYFAVPRHTNLTELAEKLDVSDSAASQRLRRGISKVLDSAIEGDETR